MQADFLLLAALDLPGWPVLAGISAVLAVVIWFLRRRVGTLALPDPQAFTQAFLDAGTTMDGSTAVVHEVAAVAAPVGPSPYHPKEGDEDFAEGLDGEDWDPAEGDFYRIKATITPADPKVKWDPTALGLVPADFEPDDPMEVSEQMGAMHSAERFVNGSFVPLKEGNLEGEHRLRMLFGVPKGVREVKFSMLFTRFGHVRLPKPGADAAARGRAASKHETDAANVFKRG